MTARVYELFCVCLVTGTARGVPDTACTEDCGSAGLPGRERRGPAAARRQERGTGTHQGRCCSRFLRMSSSTF